MLKREKTVKNKNHLRSYFLNYTTIVIIYLITISCSQKKSNLDLYKLIDLRFNYIEFPSNFENEIVDTSSDVNLLDLYTIRGFHNLAACNMKEALNDFKFVLKIDKNHIGAISGMIEYFTKNIGGYYDSTGRIINYDTLSLDGLNYYVNKRFTIVQDDISYYYKVRITDDYKLKLNNINKAIQINPNFYLAYEIKSIIYQLWGKDELAIKILDTLLTKKIKKNRKEYIYHNRLNINKRMKNYNEAFKDIDSIVQLSTNPEYTRAFEEFYIYKELKNFVKAKKAEEKLNEITKKDLQKSNK